MGKCKTIIQEFLSWNGSLKYNVLRDIQSFRKADEQTVRGFATPRPVIWLKFKTNSYPLIFSNVSLRDAFYAKMEDNEELTLTLEEYFWEELLSAAKVAELIHVEPKVHFNKIINHLLTIFTIEELCTKDAFKNNRILATYQQNLVLPEDTRILARTLWTPPFVLKKGITPAQFYKYLKSRT